MRVVVVGGTRFIGRALLAELLARGHEVLLVHRGRHEPPDLPGGADVRHVHVNRRELAGERAALAAFGADVVVDLCAMTGPDAEALLAALPGDPRLVVASSQDVYRAFASVLTGTETDTLPIDEAAPVRTAQVERPPRADDAWDFDERAYEKLDVERAFLARGAAVLRLPFVYGEHDYQLREEAALRRVRAGRRRIPVGPGTFLWSKGWVRDVAVALRLAAEQPAAAGQVLNVCESRTASMGLWLRRVLDAAGAGDVELVRVPDELVPEDLGLTASIRQHLLVDAGRARALLGWTDTDPVEAATRSVAWHMEHPPAGGPGDFAADDLAWTGAGRVSALAASGELAMERGLRGRVAVVTGASSGIGEASARAFAHGGAKVALLARRLDRVEALAKELHADGADALAVGADVTDQAALDAAAATVAERFGRADILVNGAGMMLLGRFDTQDPAEWHRMIQVNLIGAMQATAAFLDQLTAGGGDLVNISSVAGRKARATTSAYNASKWGLNGWSDALRQELIEARVRVIVVEPGAVRTRLADHISDDQLQADTRQMWDDVGAMEADDVADLVVYAVTRPDRVALHEVLIRPTGQVF